MVSTAACRVETDPGYASTSPIVTAIGRHMANLIVEFTRGRQVPVVHTAFLGCVWKASSFAASASEQGSESGRICWAWPAGRAKGFDVMIRASPNCLGLA